MNEFLTKPLNIEKITKIMVDLGLIDISENDI